MGDLAPSPPLLFLYVNSPCVVIGRNQNPWTEIARGGESAFFRRMSGGGAVWHDRGNLNWALITQRERHDQVGELRDLAQAFSSLGVEILPGPRGGLYAGPSSPAPGAKLSGTARWFLEKRVLHHGTLLINSELLRLRKALGGITPSTSRALPSVPSPVANLADLVPGLTVEGVAQAVSLKLCGRMALLLDDPIVESLARDVRKARQSWDWLYGNTPDFSVELQAWPGTRMDVHRGRVAAITGPGEDSLGSLVGVGFDASFLDLAEPQGK